MSLSHLQITWPKGQACVFPKSDTPAFVRADRGGFILSVTRPRKVVVPWGEEDHAALDLLEEVWADQCPSTSGVLLTVKFVGDGPDMFGYLCWSPTREGWNTLYEEGDLNRTTFGRTSVG